MFGGVRRKSSNVRAMQLFHELKQQFPTLPDHVVSACIANHTQKSNDKSLLATLEVAVAQQEPMGLTLSEFAETALSQPIEPKSAVPSDQLLKAKTPSVDTSKKTQAVVQNQSILSNPQASHTLKPALLPTRPAPDRSRPEMNSSESDSNQNVLNSSVRYTKESDSVNANIFETKVADRQVGNSAFFAKRPDSLDLPNINLKKSDRNFNNIQPSGRCSDVHKLLNSDNVNNKPPRSPITSKRFSNTKNSPTKTTYSTITSPLASPETNRRFITGEALENSKTAKTETKRETADTPTQTTDTLLGGSSVNLSVNVNCSMDLVQSPTRPKCTTSLQVVPQQPWCQDIVSPRSYTSVNLTLRPPSSEPQPPIDITSQNSSLTYSTSSFDPQKGLQSRLQITVGPGGGGVSSMRTRPRSYHSESNNQDVVPMRAGSLPDLAGKPSPIIEKQQAVIEKLKIELRTDKVKLVAMQGEVTALENSQNNAVTRKIEADLEKQLQAEIQHLREECHRLTQEVDLQCGSRVPLGETRPIFYDDIYTGQRGPITLGFPTEQISSQRNRPQHQVQPPCLDYDDTKWNCQLCTFRNHHLLDKCEQCEMPRIVHGKKDELRSRPYAPNYNPNMQYLEPNYMNARPNGLSGQYSSPANLSYQHNRPNALTTQFSSPAAFNRNVSIPNSTSFDQTGNSYPAQNGQGGLYSQYRYPNQYGNNIYYNPNYVPNEAINTKIFTPNGN